MSEYTEYYLLIIGLIGYVLGYFEGRRRLRGSNTMHKKGNSTDYREM